MTEEIHRDAREKYKTFKISELMSNFKQTEIQRVVQEERVNEIFTSLRTNLDRNVENILPGVLIVAELKEDLYLLDGQHRFLAYARFYQECHRDLKVMVNIITVESKEEMKDIFNLVNNTLPVNQIPETLSDRKIVNKIIEHFKKKYGKIFSSCQSMRPFRPNIHITQFENCIFELVMCYPDESAENIIQRLEDLNNDLKRKSDEYLQKDANIPKKSFTKIKETAVKKGNLFFGLYQDLSCITKLYSYKPNEPFVRCRINPALRERVWNAHHHEEKEAQCPFCSAPITLSTCHIAHDIPASRGGDYTINNLYPCCPNCNLSMGTQTYDEWKASRDSSRRTN